MTSDLTKLIAAFALSVYLLFGLPRTVEWAIRHSGWIESHRSHE